MNIKKEVLSFRQFLQLLPLQFVLNFAFVVCFPFPWAPLFLELPPSPRVQERLSFTLSHAPYDLPLSSCQFTVGWICLFLPFDVFPLSFTHLHAAIAPDPGPSLLSPIPGLIILSMIPAVLPLLPFVSLLSLLPTYSTLVLAQSRVISLLRLY